MKFILSPMIQKLPLFLYRFCPNRVEATSYEQGSTYTVGFSCNLCDSAAAVYSFESGSPNSNPKSVESMISDHKLLIKTATPEKSASISIWDEDGERSTLLVRHAGKTALNPGLN